MKFDSLYTPSELCQELEGNAYFTEDQALYIAAEVYQPLLEFIESLDKKVDELAKNISDREAS